MKLADLGNIYSSGNAFTTKAALLQSKYRFENNEPCGLTTVSLPDGYDEKGNPRKKPVRKEYGHILKDGEWKNKNFFDEDIFQYALKRVKEKKTEETIKADRLFNNLLSSMPLTFNLFKPLMRLLEQDSEKASQLMDSLFPEFEIARVEKIDIEYIPLPIADYTNDKSAMDAVILFSAKNGTKNIIAIEVKYTDSLGTNKASDNLVKYNTAIETKLFTEAGLKQIHSGCTQIFRNFLLTEKYRMVHGLANSYNVILSPKGNPTTEAEINSIKKYFVQPFPKNKLQKYELEKFISIIAQHVPIEMEAWIEWFDKRYLRFNEVDGLYTELKNK